MQNEVSSSCVRGVFRNELEKQHVVKQSGFDIQSSFQCVHQTTFRSGSERQYPRAELLAGARI